MAGGFGALMGPFQGGVGTSPGDLTVPLMVDASGSGGTGTAEPGGFPMALAVPILGVLPKRFCSGLALAGSRGASGNGLVSGTGWAAALLDPEP